MAEEKLNVSLIATLLNEEKNIDVFLKSVFSQTKVPDELILVDGGSTDESTGKIKKWGNRVKLIKKTGTRGVGRNTAIEAARNEIIAVSDIGCRLDKNWLKEITKPFLKKSIDVVAGYYKPVTRTVFEKCLATYTSTMPDNLNPDNFLPSSRSIAFRRSAWNKVGGYPEGVSASEDLHFAQKLKSSNLTFFTQERAIVYWPQRANFKEAFRQFFSYARGDAEGMVIRTRVVLLFMRFFIFTTLLFLSLRFQSFLLIEILFILYMIYAIMKNYSYIRNPQAFYMLPLLQLTADAAVFLGTIQGLLIRCFTASFQKA